MILKDIEINELPHYDTINNPLAIPEPCEIESPQLRHAYTIMISSADSFSKGIKPGKKCLFICSYNLIFLLYGR